MAGLSQRSMCIDQYVSVGFTRDEAERMCAKRPDVPPPLKSLDSPPPKGKAPHTKSGSLIPIGVSTSRAVSRGAGAGPTQERQAAIGQAVGGNLGNGVVAYPDSAKAARAFQKGLGRPVTASDRDEWFEYARRIGLQGGAAEDFWGKVVKASQKPLRAAVEDLNQVFGENTQWQGYSLPGIHQIKMRHGGPQMEPPPGGTAKQIKDLKKGEKAKKPPGETFPVALPSFPYHTKEAAAVWKAALDLVLQYPKEGPAEILKLALSKAGVAGIELTPEDEKLLQMAIGFAQNGPPEVVGKIIGAGHEMSRKGKP